MNSPLVPSLSAVAVAALIGSCFAGASLSMPTVAAEPDEVIRLWEGRPPGFQVDAGEERNLSNADSRKVAGKSVIRLGGVSDPELHVYRPAEGAEQETAIVICPGGGFSILAWDLEGTEVAEWLQSIGVTAAVLKYRTPTRDDDPRWQAPASDAQRAVRQLRARSAAADWGIEHLGILGFSAGGQTAARAAVAAGQPYYPPQDSLDRDVSAQVDFAVLVYPAYLLGDDGKLDPAFAANDATPPMFFAHAQDDPITCLGSVELFRTQQQAGIPSELHVYAGGGHGFGMRPTVHACSRWPARCEAWMRQGGWLPPTP